MRDRLGVSERLNMGHYSRVTQAIRRMKQRPGKKLTAMNQKLNRLAVK